MIGMTWNSNRENNNIKRKETKKKLGWMDRRKNEDMTWM